MDAWERWEWGGPDWEARGSPASELAIVAAEMQGANPEAMATRWSGLLERPLEPIEGGWRICLDEGELRFVPLRDGRGEGFRGIDIRSRRPDEINQAATQRGRLAPDGSLSLWGMSIRVASEF
jgi:hypothetical protein